MAKALGYTRLTIPGMPELSDKPAVLKIGGKLIEEIIDKHEEESKRIEAEIVKRVVVTNIEQIDGEVIEALQAGDMVIKRDSSGDHSYRVSFKSATGICMTYSDCENVETVAYDKVEGVWTYDSTDVTNIGS